MRSRIAGVALTILAACLLPISARSAPGGLRDQIIGTWTYVSVDVVQPDGTRLPMYGPHPRGIAVFDATGHYILLTARADLAKFAVGNRLGGTADENKAVVQGSIAHFGQYEVDEASRTISFHIDTSTFPNWNGTDQRRPVSVSGDTLKWMTPGSSGGTAEVVLRRVR